MKLTALLAWAPLAQLCLAGLPATPASQLRKMLKTSAEHQKRSTDHRDQVVSGALPAPPVPEYYLDVPVDHFHNDSKYAPHSNGQFKLRYWFDDSFYKPGGPVFVLAGGETDGSDRLPYLSKGILYILSKATGGLGVILEHRYYGNSFPTADLSTENLRFLTTDQALADTAYFAQNVVFKGHKKADTDPKNTPWIAYGGSYAGAFVAFLRKLYPNVYFGAISSSGVTEAIYDYWRYFEPIAQAAPQDCVRATQVLTGIVDNILIKHKNTTEVANLKTLFGLQDVKYDNDFANSLTSGITQWQGRNWDPKVGSPNFYEYCDILTNTSVTYPDTNRLQPQIAHILEVTGHGSDGMDLTVAFQNYIGYVNASVVQPCVKSGEKTDQCVTTHDPSVFKDVRLSTYGVRSWPYQYCTQWGFLQTGSGVPKDQPTLISRTIDLEYTSLICKYAFNITKPPDVNAVNKYGGFNISYPRLAIIDGEVDPWRPATPHSLQAPPRKSTTDEPYILIKDAVHHWDENGLFPNETTPSLPPQPVKDAQAAEVDFVKAWLKEWKKATHY